jgi:hypothetical protein
MAVITWHAKGELLSAACAYLKPVPVVLDVGCGIRPQTFIPNQLHICVEPFLPYLTALRRQNPDRPGHVLLHGTWDQVLPLLPDQSVDTVVAGDMIEHLEKAEGQRFLSEAQRVARAQIVLFTPLGFHPQNYEGRRDAWGMDGGHWQTHRSGWTPEEFGDGWVCLCCADYHNTDDHGQPCEPFGAFYALKL